MAYKMYDEMIEQSSSIKETLKSEKLHMTELGQKFQDFDQIYLVGCGSSLSTSYSARDALNFVSDNVIDVNTGYEFYYHKKFKKNNSAIILTSQSGETADTLAALKRAKKNNLYTVAITNEENSSMMKAADDTILTECGPESAILGTKTYLTQFISLYQILFTMDGSKASKSVLKDLSKLPIIIDDLVRTT
jgi:glucosamine 6-phosphate synthetase-like amidotransferase/phosphosugar isomerase protein